MGKKVIKGLEDDQIDLETEPSDIHWSLSNEAPCGSIAFNRPCQMAELHEDAEIAPLGRGCKTQSELVFVVEDDDDLREALIELLQANGYTTLGCSSALEFTQMHKQADSGCVVLDIRLPGRDGLSILEALEAQKSALVAVVLSGLSDPVIAAKCMKLGAHEYLAKPFHEIELLRATERAIGISRVAFCRNQSRTLLEQLFAKLTPSEMKVAEMLSKGYPTKWIAGELGRSENTIKIHRHRIMAKLKISTPASISNMINYLRS